MSIGDCIDKQDVKWIQALNSAGCKRADNNVEAIADISKNVQYRIMTGDKTLVLPLISYYGTGRLYAQKKGKSHMDATVEFNRQMGYKDCLAAESNEKLMLKWFKKEIMKSLQNQQKTGVLECTKLLREVERAICKCFERISGAVDASLMFELDTNRLVLKYTASDGIAQQFAIDEMSDGYKNTLSMIGDIAYRMAVLNPILEERVLEETPGVVLIDEVDLHLHPQWQQTILSDLHAIFPKVQFIVTSHAPAVINSVSKRQIRILDNGEIYVPAAETYGRDTNSILREVMKVSERPVEIKQRIDLFTPIWMRRITKGQTKYWRR